MGKHILLIGVSEGELATEYAKQSPVVANINALKQTLLSEVDDLRGDQIITLINPDLQQMRHALALITYRCRHDDLCLIYYTGCGVIDARTGTIYLPANNTRLDTLTTSAISSDYIRQALPSIHTGLSRVMILDCMWGALPSQHHTPPSQTTLDLEQQPRLSATQLADCNCSLFTALGSSAQPWPTTAKGLSLYTHCLIEGITTGLADVDADGSISTGDLETYMAQTLNETDLEIFPIALCADGGSNDDETSGRDSTGIGQGDHRTNGNNHGATPPLLFSAKPYSPEREYHRSVTEYAQRHQGLIAPDERNILEFLRHELGITPQQAQAIEVEVMRPYVFHQENCDRYRHAFMTALGLEAPLGTPLKKWLRHLQGELSLSYDEVSDIEAQVLTHHQPIPQLQTLPRWLTPLDTPKLPVEAPRLPAAKPNDDYYSHANGHANGHGNNHHSNGHANGHSNSHANGHSRLNR